VTHSLEGCCSIQLSYGQMEKQKGPRILAGTRAFVVENGRGERIRTFDPLVPNQMRYQAALRSEAPRLRHKLRPCAIGNCGRNTGHRA
jgi:hypothetical protein